MISSHEEMITFGEELAEQLRSKVVCFEGDLGAGKTTLIKGIISKLTSVDPDSITSPTFNIMSMYDDLLHFDCYRIKSSQEFMAMGLDDELTSKKTILIEWPEKIASLLPKQRVTIRIEHVSQNAREVVIVQN
ncbi:MAG: tRNA (adenosine(37)-N6)-threonylcarbamoyltransferase complex ATPase subunit type 1 TsaE [Rhabdochlamydiaceae bacterium]|nr:tRNA (adenosine(37)-N6)-threonylcarbamoyltransferase complex ATPase subunit type 1 TsaE [Candidatus Amphrikana amoebophyrae]